MTDQLHPAQRFDSFVIGGANRLAATAARAVAEAPSAVYNPLFIYARPGLGKTHLLMAIGHAVRAVAPAATIEYVTLDEFVEAFATAVAAGQAEGYRRRYTELDVLLVDDVQFLAGRREMQAELLRILDGLQAAGRQVVLASDRPPAEIEALDDRLIRRFAGGLVIDIGAPDYETRVAILRRRSEERRAAFAPAVLEAVAALDIDNVRELIGALNRLIAFQAVSDAPLEAVQAQILVGGAAVLERLEAEHGPDAVQALAAPPVAPAPAPPAPPEEPAPAADEFGDFLSEVAATVAQQVETWRARVAGAVMLWESEGYATARLEALLAGEMTADPEEALRAYEQDVERLRAMEAEAVELAPELAGAGAFRDPGNLAAADAALERARNGATPPPAPSAALRLEELAEGGANRMALRAAAAIVAEPGRRYNPLVVVGASGTGKSHLLHGLGNALAAAGGAVACLGAQTFVDECIAALERDTVAAWRARYRRTDALLLDDVHLLAGKERSQEELFLLFNLLAEREAQMAFTSAVPLAQLDGLEPRLLTRLEGGLVVELLPPDRDVRQCLVERLLAERGVPADAELTALLAGRPAESVRAVQGLVQRVVNAAESQGVVPSAALARELLDGAPRPPRRPALRGSGVGAPGGTARNREKMIRDWPDVADRIIEEWR